MVFKISCCVRFLVPLRFSCCLTVEFWLFFFVCRVKMYYNLKVLHQLLMVLFLHLGEEILHLLLDLRCLLENLKMLDETIQGPNCNLIVLQ